MHNNNDFDLPEKKEISKTKIKAHMQELQDLGMALVKLSKSQLDKIELPDSLLDAIASAKTINSHRALKRNSQYIGKLMRDVDESYIRERLSFVLGESAVGTRILHSCEDWRDKLIESDDSLDEFIVKYPNCDITELRQLVRVIRKELKLNQNKSYRKLFQFIKNYIID